MPEDYRRFLPVPFFPAPPRTGDATPKWGEDLTFALNRAFIDVATRLENLNLGGTTEELPDAIGGGNLFYDSDTGTLYFDNGTWIPVGGGPSMARTVGFEDKSDTSLSWDRGTRTLTISPTGDDFTFWVDGQPTVKSAGESVQITDTEGTHHIYYTSAGTLTASTSATALELIYNNAYVANIYWDATNNMEVFVGDERHELMDPDVHYWIHTYGGGTAYGSGLSLDITSDGDGSSDHHAELGVNTGTFIDEDLPHSVDAKASPASIPVFYKTGLQGYWRADAAAQAPIKFSGGVPQINTYGGSGWTQTAVSNTNFFLMHIFAINDYRQANIIVAVQGEDQYTTLVSAQNGAETELGSLYTNGLPMAEFLPIGTIIYEYKTSFTNSYDCRIRATSTGDDYVDWLVNELTPGDGPTSHATLSDRTLADQHPFSALTSPSDVAIDMNDNEITNVNWIDFNTSFSDGHQEGRLHWNSDDGTLEIGMPGGDVSCQIGQEVLFRCRNTSGAQIDNGSVVKIVGATGGKPQIELASTTNIWDGYSVVGVATEDISNNDNGYVTSIGLVRDVNTSSFSPGDALYLSNVTPGALTDTYPTPPEVAVHVAVCITSSASNGIIMVKTMPSAVIQLAQDVYVSSLADGHILVWDNSDERFENSLLDDSLIPLSGTHTGLLTSATNADDAMTVLDDIKDGIYFNKGADLYWGNEADTLSIEGISKNTSDQLVLGGGMAGVVLTGTMYHSNGGEALINYSVISSRVQVGDSSEDIAVLGTSLLTLPAFQNNFGYMCEDTSANERTVLRIDSSDDVNVGHASHPLNLLSDGTVDAGSADVLTSGRLEPGEIHATHSTTLSDGVTTEIFRLYLDAETGCGATMWYRIYAVDASNNIETESGMVTYTGYRQTVGGTTATNPSTFGTNAEGSMTVTAAAGTVGSDHIRCRINANSTLTSPTITAIFGIVMGDANTITWSI